MKILEDAAREYSKTNDFTEVAKRIYADFGKTECTNELIQNPITLLILLENHQNTEDSFCENMRGFYCSCKCISK
jgi:hypothetical protein